MSRSKVISLQEAAGLIPSGAVVSISSSSGLGCPDAVLRALGDRYKTTGEPRTLTTVHPIAAGDMYGIDGIDHLAQPGLLKRVIAGSYPSGPSSLPSPKIWQMIYENQVEAYNLPSGIIFQMHREAAAGCPGVLTKVGLDTCVDPRRSGGRMNEITTEDIVHVVEFDGREWLYFPVIPVDVSIIRGTTADELGNISMEHEGSYLGVLDQALAARNNGGLVIGQVQRLTSAGSIAAQQVRMPGVLVDYVVLAPDQMQTTQTSYDPAISGELRRLLSSFSPLEWGPEKVIARRTAMELCRGEVVSLGFGISALVPRILIEEGAHDDVTWVIEQGAVGGIPLTGFQFGCALNPQAIVPSSDQFIFFQGGGPSRALLSFLQVDQYGNVNVSRLSALPHVTAGVGGFIDITARTPNLVFSGFYTAGGLKLALEGEELHIVNEGRTHKFVSEVEDITLSGRRALQQGQDLLYVTERCVLSLGQEGLIVNEIAPGIDLERDVLAQADFRLHVSPDLRLMDRRLFHPEPMGLTLTC
ncbi:MAG: acyl CoA:acetate/3-ketoacid CoA transferase [Deltaproteobacteria bacterium]|nr:MAG: acyl CoA:acetate/3-ketoacid CoA transferase [Deltaproteobacteria bacterium]